MDLAIGLSIRRIARFEFGGIRSMSEKFTFQVYLRGITASPCIPSVLRLNSINAKLGKEGASLTRRVCIYTTASFPQLPVFFFLHSRPWRLRRALSFCLL